MQKPDPTVVMAGAAGRCSRAAGALAQRFRSVNNNVVNAVLFQANWFACVIGGTSDRLWMPSLTLCLMLVLSARQHTRQHDMYLFIAAAAIGLVLDSVWIRLGILDFGTTAVAPVWIVMMWMGVALTINHSLRWLQRQPLLGGLLAAVSAPLCYLGGQRLGAVQVDASGLPLIAVTWMLLFSVCFWWARQRSAQGLA